MSNQQLPTTDQQRYLGIIITKDHQWQKQTEKSWKNKEQSTGVHCPQYQVQKQRTDPPTIQMPSQSASRTCSACNTGPHTYDETLVK